MASIQEIQEFMLPLMDLLEQHLGINTELVLHDSHDYSKTIVDIRNGHITGRSIGGCGSELGLEVMRSAQPSDENIKSNYITYTRDGKILRSSTIYFKNEQNEMIGSFCINTDITKTVQLEAFLRDYNNYSPGQEKPVNEIFVTNIQQLLEELIQRGFQLIGKCADEMNREEKIAFIRFLDSKGAFFISKSSERVWELLGISKFTFYSYLDLARSADDKQKEGAEASE